MELKIRDIAKNWVVKRIFGYGPTDDYSYVDQFGGPVKDIRLLGLYSGVAYRCINTLSEAVAGQYIPYLFTLDNKGKQITIPTHPLLDLLNKPNPNLTYYQLLEGMTSFTEQFGEFFLYMVGGSLSGYSQGVKEMYLLRPDKVGIQLDKNTGDVLGYKYQVGTAGSTIPFTPEEIMHFMTFNPKNPYRGYSTIEAALDYIMTEEEVSRFTKNYFRNNAAMSGILEVTGKITRENWNKFVRQWRERYEGPNNAGKVALVRDSQTKFTPINSSISDMQLNDLKETTVDQILMMFRIPKGLFGMESDQGLGRASVETLEYIFAKWTIDNKLSRLDDFFEQIVQKYYPKLIYQVGHNNIIPDDKEYELNKVNLLVDRVITRKEVRDRDPELQNNPIDGSDQLFQTIQQIPLDSDVADTATTPTPAPEPDEDDAKAIKLVKAKKKDLNYSTNQKEVFRLGIERNASAYARRYRKSFNKVLKEQEKTVLSNITHLKGKDSSSDYFDMGEEDSNIDQELMPVLLTLMNEQGQLALDFSGADIKFQISESIKNAVQKSTKKMGQNFNQETISQLNFTINEGLSNGENLTQLSDRVSIVYQTARDYRSDRVARTESQNASNEATLDAYQQNPVVISMQWYANPDACEFCAELDGTVVGLEDVFVAQGDSVDVSQDDGSTDSYQADYGDVETPPLHPNCSCTIIPITE